MVFLFLFVCVCLLLFSFGFVFFNKLDSNTSELFMGIFRLNAVWIIKNGFAHRLSDSCCVIGYDTEGIFPKEKFFYLKTVKDTLLLLFATFIDISMIQFELLIRYDTENDLTYFILLFLHSSSVIFYLYLASSSPPPSGMFDFSREKQICDCVPVSLSMFIVVDNLWSIPEWYYAYKEEKQTHIHTHTPPRT